MKPILSALCVLALVPVAAAAADPSSPRAQCLEKAARHERSVSERLVRIENRYLPNSPESRSAYNTSYVTMRYGTSTGDSVDPRTDAVYAGSYRESSVSFSIPSDYQVLKQELRFIAWRKSECARLPETEQGIAQRTTVTRANVAWK